MLKLIIFVSGTSRKALRLDFGYGPILTADKYNLSFSWNSSHYIHQQILISSLAPKVTHYSGNLDDPYSSMPTLERQNQD
jgi:hypothetical protein